MLSYLIDSNSHAYYANVWLPCQASAPHSRMATEASTIDRPILGIISQQCHDVWPSWPYTGISPMWIRSAQRRAVSGWHLQIHRDRCQPHSLAKGSWHEIWKNDVSHGHRGWSGCPLILWNIVKHPSYPSVKKISVKSCFRHHQIIKGWPIGRFVHISRGCSLLKPTEPKLLFESGIAWLAGCSCWGQQTTPQSRMSRQNMIGRCMTMRIQSQVELFRSSNLRGKMSLEGANVFLSFFFSAQ